MGSRTDYENSICQRLGQAELVPFRMAAFADGSAPQPNGCHRYADRWVEENSSVVALRGWVTFADYGLSVGLTAHPVVRGTDGQMFDITPLGNERDRKTMRFVPHVGDEWGFWSMMKSNIFIECPRRQTQRR